MLEGTRATAPPLSSDESPTLGGLALQPVLVHPLPSWQSPGPRCLSPATSAKVASRWHYGGTGRSSAGAPTARSAAVQAPRAPHGQGRDLCKNRGAGPHRHGHRHLRGLGSRRARGAPVARRRSSPARPAAGRRAALESQGRRARARSPPAPLPASEPPAATTDPTALLSGPYRGAQGCAPDAERLQIPSRSPGGCSFLEKLGRGRERKGGGRREGTEIEGKRSMQRQEVETATASAGD